MFFKERILIVMINVAFWLHICIRINELNETLEATIDALAATNSAQKSTVACLKNIQKHLNKE